MKDLILNDNLNLSTAVTIGGLKGINQTFPICRVQFDPIDANLDLFNGTPFPAKFLDGYQFAIHPEIDKP